MEKLQIALCEDQPGERQHLADLIRSGAVPAQATVFSSGEAFLEEYRPGRYDLVFMDIYMDGITGVEAVRRVREADGEVPIVFVTSSLEFALEGYRLNVAKYLEKPVSQEAVDESLALAKERRERRSRLAVVLGEKEYRLPLRRLICAEQKGHYLLLSFEGGKTEQIKGRLDELAPQLAGLPFFRCHKSYLANLAYVTAVDKELLLLRMREGHDAYIRREDLKKAKDTWESYLFAQIRAGGGN